MGFYLNKDFILRLASLYSGFNSSYFKSSAMSLACPIPNYGRRGLLSDTRGRLHSAPPDVTYVRKLMAKSIGQDEFMQIKDKAKQSLKDELNRSNASATSYGGMHGEKTLDAPTNVRRRPSSASRKNNPHPPEVFLVNRLRSVPGYYQPHKAGIVHEINGRNRSKVLRFSETSGRPGRPNTAYTNLLQREHMQSVLGPMDAQAAEAWLKLSPEKERGRIRSSMNNFGSGGLHGVTNEGLRRGCLSSSSSLRSQTKPPVADCTLTWLEQSRYSKNESLQKLSESMRKAPATFPWKTPKKQTGGVGVYPPSLGRYPDYQVHPQWHMSWHKQYEANAPRYPPQIYA